MTRYKITEWIDSKVWTEPDRTLEQDARWMGFPCTDVLRGYFKSRFGESFVSFRARLRISRAEILMRLDSDATMASIASKCGFNQRQLFEKYFRTFRGITPAEWKKQFERK